jgi:hypothetical protein
VVKPANYFPLHEIKICGVRYSVGEVKDLRDEEGERRFYGKISHVHLTIDIEEDMARDVKIQAALHESLHGLFHHTGNFDIDEEERIVQMLGCQLPQFLRENQTLVELLMGQPRVIPNPGKLCVNCHNALGAAADIVVHPTNNWLLFCSHKCYEEFD